MSAVRKPPPAVIEEQHKASNPAVSAWVSANAGSGKTHVLTERVIRLLLAGTPPEKILCITFTKAAAANMATRVFDTLSRWTALDDAGLDARISALGLTPSADARARARRLFAIAIETPGGLKVQTIHAFCTRLLHQFPFEAGVAARFNVLDDATERQLLEKLTLDVVLEGAANPGNALGKALETAVTAAADQTFREVIRTAIGKRDLISGWISRAGSLDGVVAELSQALGVSPDETVDSVEAEFFSAALIPHAQWADVAAVLAQGQATDLEQARRFAAMRERTGQEQLDLLLEIHCTRTFEPRTRLVTRTIADAHPALAERLRNEQTRICALLERRRALLCRDRTRALLTLAYAIITRYRLQKDRRGLLDYDDLIDKTLALLRNTSAAWVLYKLDLGIDHILIDEAQDTSPRQWEIIRALANEFTAGAGARGVARTLFAVGDDKQSIFSFQGADPKIFAEIASGFERDFRDAELVWEHVRLRTSFRSGPAILGAVDIVFKNPEAHAGFTADPAGTVHEALPDAAPGVVDIWPLVLPDDRNDIEGWDAPFDTRRETSPQVRLARKIARQAAGWIWQGWQPRDIILLVRQRGALFESVIRALKAADIPVAGADRLVLTEHIAVMDMMALADALLLPEDDLALATVLKSPLFELSEDDLFKIAWDRKEPSLRAALAVRASVDARLADAARTLEALAAAAKIQSPFTFYANLLGAHRGRERFLSRLGPEANDAIDEFLNLALDYERREAPSLQGFVAWLRAAQSEIKRDMEFARDEVRVMTVHGAKGLEAPIVVLADTTTRPEGYHPPRLIDLPVGDHEGLIWGGARATDSEAVGAARADVLEAARHEHNRLLYVALTRARSRLIVCGTAARVKNDGTPVIPDGCWYRLIEDTLLDHSDTTPAEDGDGTIRRFRKSALPQIAAAKPEGRGETKSPAWLALPVASEGGRVTAITPSGSPDDDARHTASSFDRDSALLRGTLVHRLMQSLPDIAPEFRAEAARRYLARAGKELRQHDRDEIAGQVFAILDNPAFQPLFAPGSRAEVPIVGRLGAALVSGQVDRLAVTDDAVLITDYKTNRPAPRHLDDALENHRGYLRQLALYRDVLRNIFPRRNVRAALIWTDIPSLMDIPHEALDRALDAEFATLTRV
jgi:ATP-dependent helicase/nuclease subunit A